MAKEPAWHGYLFLGTHGHVIAVRKIGGRRVWTTSLPNTGYSVVSIVCEDGTLYCASGGRVFALEPDTGEIRWTNGLRGMGHGQVYQATACTKEGDGQSAVFAQETAHRRQAAASASGASAT